jgi:hypothetical protein
MESGALRADAERKAARPRAWSRRPAENVRYWLRYRFNCYQPYLKLIEWKYRDRPDRIIRPETELVIEGFGRSASSYAVVCLELAQDRPVGSAHHTHAAAQVVKAAGLRLPTIVIVKKPDEVAISHMVRHPGLQPQTILRAWIRFHRTVATVADRAVVISVDELDRNYGGVIERLNDRFGTSFVPPPATEEFDKRVHDEMWQRHLRQRRPDLHFGRPTPERQRAKEAMRHRLEAPRLQTLRREANDLYASLTGEPVISPSA